MRLSRKKMWASAAIALAAAASVAPAAFADTGSTPSTTAGPTEAAGNGTATVASIQARAATAISVRQSALQSAITSVTSNRYLTSTDRSTILSVLNSDLAGLGALGPVIQADTTLVKVRADYLSIFTQYRVFALALPQARMAAAADDLTGTVLPRLTNARSRLQALLAGRDSAKNTAAVQAAMSDLGNRISAVSSATDGLSAAVLALTPAAWNGNHAILAEPRARLVAARADARRARDDIRTVIEALRS